MSSIWRKPHIYCPLIVDGVKIFLNVYGKEIAKSKGSKTKEKSFKTKDMEVIPLPKTLVETHNSDTLAMD